MGPAGSNKRVLSPQWPILDQKFSECVEGHISVGYPITGPLIQYKAAEYWKKIPEYRDLPTPLSLMAGLLGSNNTTPSDI